MDEPVNPDGDPSEQVDDEEEEADDVRARSALLHGALELGIMVVLVSEFAGHDVLDATCEAHDRQGTGHSEAEKGRLA